MSTCLIRIMIRKDMVLMTRYNRIVPWKYFNKIALNVYSLGPYQGREAIILFNKNTELTSEKTIEYFI